MVFRLFRAKTPSVKDGQAHKVVADAVDSAKNAENDANNAKELTAAQSSNISAKSKSTTKSTTKSTSSAKTTTKSGTRSSTKSKTTKETKPEIHYSPRIQEILTKSEKIALIAVVQTANKIADIGKYSHYEVVDETTGIHYFESAMTGYVGWKWAVTLSLLDENEQISILECNLVAGPDSIKVPRWVPFKERLKPSDISDVDELPYDPDDSRLEDFISKVKVGGIDADIAVSRVRVLSPYGKAELAGRWYEGNHGPNTASTRISKANCMSCGFYLPIAGDLGQVFGVCANAWSRDDGRVVSGDHGCGMHSETDAKQVKRWKESDFVDEEQIL